MALKNRYLAIIYSGCLKNKPVRKIHKELYDETISTKRQYADKVLLAMMIKTANKAKKIRAESPGLLAVALFDLFKREKTNDKAKKAINHEVQREAENRKDAEIADFMDQSRRRGEWFYLASSHNDCAEDHKPYQGRLYVDNKAPEDVISYAKDRALYTVQWVMGSPAWFITRPNCRHYFVSLTEQEVRKKTLKKLAKKYKTHTKEGDRRFSTPKTVIIGEYEDRLRMLRALYREYPTEILKKEIQKTEMLIKKWKKQL